MFANINGTRLFYQIDGDGPACFVLHGGLGLDHSLYRSTLQRLTSSQLRVIYIDHRGNGRSARPAVETVTVNQLADDVVGLADHLGIDRFLVFGHSYGGMIAQQVAGRHPDRLCGLLLVGTAPGQLGMDEDPNEYPVAPRPAVLRALLQENPVDDASCAALWYAVLPYFTNPDCVEALTEEFTHTIFAAAALVRSNELYATWSSIDYLAGIQAPTLVIVGSNDIIFPPAQSLRIASRVQRATTAVLKGSNHFPWIETTEAFYDVVNRWLEQEVHRGTGATFQ